MSKEESLIFGRHPVIDAIHNDITIEKVILLEGTRGEVEKEMRYLCREKGIPMTFAPRDRMNKMAGGANHQGLMAIQSSVTYHELSEVIRQAVDKGEVPLILLLDNITDVRNIGAIARSAEVFGAHAIVVPQQGGALITGEAIKSSAGALSLIPVCRVKSIHSAATTLAEAGIMLFGGDLKANKLLHQLELNQPCAFLLGSEGRGLHPSLLKLTDDRFLIPQYGKTDSLNVSVSAALMLYETIRQRNFGA